MIGSERVSVVKRFNAYGKGYFYKIIEQSNFEIILNPYSTNGNPQCASLTRRGQIIRVCLCLL